MFDNEIYNCSSTAVLTAEKLEWGNLDHLSGIIENHPGGFDLVLGADIYILEIFVFILRFWPFSSIHLLYSSPCSLWTLTRRKLPAI